MSWFGGVLCSVQTIPSDVGVRKLVFDGPRRSVRTQSGLEVLAHVCMSINRSYAVVICSTTESPERAAPRQLERGDRIQAFFL